LPNEPERDPSLPNITQRRIDELFQLINNARTHELQFTNKDKLFPIDPKWDFKKLVVQQQSTDHKDGNEQNPETHTDSAAKTTIHPNLTTTKKPVSEHDKIQLRNYIHRILSNWTKEHQNDKIVTIADLMHDKLAREEPS
jgi:hypothetical protein